MDLCAKKFVSWRTFFERLKDAVFVLGCTKVCVSFFWGINNKRFEALGNVLMFGVFLY